MPMMRPLSYALRTLQRAPTFTATVVAILALAIGMAAAMLTVYQSILVRRLPVVDQDRIVALWGVGQGAATESPIDLRQFESFRRDTRTLRSAAAFAHFGAWPFATTDGGEPIPLRQARVTGDFFEVLGVPPVLGRLLRPTDDVDGAAPVMVISYGLWQRHFGGDSTVLGRRLGITALGLDYTIVGVAPAGLDYPARSDYWIPIVPTKYGSVDVLGRLAPGVAPTAAAGELFEFGRREDERQGLGTSRWIRAEANTLPNVVFGDVRRTLLALTAAVGLLLLIACVNIANLLLLRAVGRARELAIRRAIGADHWSIARQLLLENVLLAIAGGALGLLVANALLRALLILAPGELPRLDVVAHAASPVTPTIAVTLLSLLLFGIAPALGSGRGDLLAALRFDVRSGTESRRRRRVRHVLVGAQVALALLVLSSAGLLIRTFDRLHGLDLGYERDRLSVAQISLQFARYGTVEKLYPVLEDIYGQIRRLPSVVALTPVLITPFSGSNVFAGKYEAEAFPTSRNADTAPWVSIESIGAEYFQTFGVPLIRGRAFTDDDRENAPRVAIVSEQVARTLWRGEDPIGKRLRAAGDTSNADARTVVGIAGDVHYRTHRDSTPTIYFPYRQFFTQGFFAVRTRTEIASVVPAMRRIVQSVDPTAVLWKAESMGDLLAEPLARPRFNALLLAAFGIASLALAAIGLYGVVAFSVRQQARDLGVRLALGATPRRLLQEVVRRALLLVSSGAIAGLVAALATTRLLATLLFEVSPTDFPTFAAMTALLIGVAFVAAYVPARRATRVDPVQTLRSE
jgi:putative ABC transport system permease protein